MFKLGDLLVDRVILGLGETLKGQLLFTLTNLQNAQFQLSSDSTDAQAGDGSTIKTFYRNRTCEVTATNALLNLPIVAAMGGTPMQVASADTALTVPRIITTSTATTEIKDLTDASTQNVKVNAINTNGTLGDKYTLASSTTASAGQFVVADGKLTISPNTGDTKWVIEYDRTVTDNACKIIIKANKFPTNMKMTFKVVVYDPCEPDTARAAYVVMPNFQPSPDLDLNIQNDGTTLDFSGRANVDYCSADKTMLIVYMNSEDTDEDTI